MPTAILPEEALLALIGEVYDRALEPDGWPALLERFAGLLQAVNGKVIRRDAAGAAMAWSWGVPDAVRHAYFSRHAKVNPFVTALWHCAPDEPASLARFMTTDALRATRFHREFLGPLGCLDFVTIVLERTAAHTTDVSFSRPADAPGPGPSELRLVGLLAPHIRRALALHGAVEQGRTGAADLAELFDLVALPLMLLDGAGRCIEANAAGERLLGERGLAQQVAAAAAPARRGPGWSTVLAGEGGRRLLLHALPVHRGLADRLAAPGSAVAAVLVQEAGALRALPGDVLVGLYGLTPAETRLLGLLGGGLGLAEAADALGIAMPTARTHLQRLFAKTGTTRQAELVRLVLSALPPPPG